MLSNTAIVSVSCVGGPKPHCPLYTSQSNVLIPIVRPVIAVAGSWMSAISPVPVISVQVPSPGKLGTKACATVNVSGVHNS